MAKKQKSTIPFLGRVIIGTALIIGGLIYISTTVDLIPDQIGIVGFIDDAIAMAGAGYLARSVVGDTKKLWSILSK